MGEAKTSFICLIETVDVPFGVTQGLVKKQTFAMPPRGPGSGPTQQSDPGSPAPVPPSGPPISAVRMNLQRPPLPSSPSFHANSPTPSPRGGGTSSKGTKSGGIQKRTETWQKNLGSGNRGTPPAKGGVGVGSASGVRMTVPPPISASAMGVILPPDRTKRKLADK